MTSRRRPEPAPAPDPTCASCTALAAEMDRHAAAIQYWGPVPEVGPDRYAAHRRASRTTLRLASDADDLTHQRRTVDAVNKAWDVDMAAGLLDRVAPIKRPWFVGRSRSASHWEPDPGPGPGGKNDDRYSDGWKEH